MNCSNCGHENRDSAKFCLGCGQRFSGVCRGCGNELPTAARFCDECGTPTAEPPAGEIERNPRSYTPNHLAEKILRSRSALEGERKQVTVLFADIQRSMDLQETVDAEEWHGIMDGFFRILAEGVHRFEGTINQYTGDGIMALFGAPIAHEDHAQRACFAALQLSERIDGYARDLKREKGLIFSVRMGLNSGEVIVGKIGDDLRMDYTAQGQIVGVASRMEELAGPGKIYLTAATHQLAEGYAEFEDLGEFRVKGVREPTRVYELRGAGLRRTRFDISLARGLTRFVGRGGEMRTLQEALERATSGDAQVVGIVADAGVGKSRLCYEFAQRCRATGIPVRVGRAVAHGKSIPLLPMMELLRDRLDIREDDDDQRARQKIAGAVVLLEDQLTEAVPLLFEFLGVPDPKRPAPPLEPEARRRQLFEVQRRLLHARSERNAAVFLLEDLHWFDPESEDHLEHLVRGIQDTRTLLLVNFRPEFRASWMGSSFYQQISLRSLGREEIDELLRELLGDDASLDELRSLIFDRTGGNPFFVEELVRSLAEAGALDGVKGAYRLCAALGTLEIPPTVQALVASRVDRLPDREKRVLQTAAVIGKDFSESVLREVAEDPEQLDEALASLLESELLHQTSLYPEVAYSFRHPVSRDVVYDSQLVERRAQVHAAVARAVERLSPSRQDDQAALLAHHWEQAGHPLEAARWTRRAAERAGSLETTAALQRWRKVRDLVEALPESEESNDLALTACLGILEKAFRIGMESQEATVVLDQGTRLAGRLGDTAALALLNAFYARILLGGGISDEGLRSAEKAMRLAEESGDVFLQLRVLPIVGNAWQLRSAPRALEMVDDAMARAPGLDSLIVGSVEHHAYVNALRLRAGAARFLGLLDEAERDSSRVLALARDSGYTDLVLNAHQQLSMLADTRGDAETALQHAARALESAERLDTPGARVAAYHTLSRAHALGKRWAESAEAAEKAYEIARSHRTGMALASGFFPSLVDAYRALGNFERAFEVLADGLNPAWGLPQGRLLIAKARLLASTRGRSAADEIQQVLDEAQADVDRTGWRIYRPSVLMERARLAQLLGNREERLQLLQKAHSLFLEMGATGHAERVARELE